MSWHSECVTRGEKSSRSAQRHRKTRVALRFGLAACQKSLRSLFTTAALVNELHESYDERRLLRPQRQFAGYNPLNVDQPGYGPLTEGRSRIACRDHQI